MENTLENAIAFYLERKSSTLTPFITKSIAQIMVDYHNSVRPEVVVPSEKDFMNAYNINAYYGNVYEFMLSELKHLNPTLAFTELNHEK